MRLSIGFSTTNNIASRLIRWFTKAHVSHTYLRIFDSTFGADLVLHADWDGVKLDLAEKFFIDNIPIEEFEVDDKRLDEAVKKNMWHLGKKYDYYKLFNWAWSIMLKRWFVRKMKDPLKSPKKLICVDFILYIFNEADITRLPIGFLTPIDLHKWCLENYKEMSWVHHLFDKEGQRYAA